MVPFILLSATIVVAQLGLFLTSAALPLYLRHVGAAQQRIGVEVGLGSIAALAATLALGPVLNRRGPRLFLILGPALYILSALIMLLLPTEPAVTVGRVVQGLGSGMVIPSALTLLPSLITRRIGAMLGVATALNNVAAAVGPPVGLVLYGHGNSAALFLAALGCGLLGLVCAVWLRVPSTHPHHVPTERRALYDRRWSGPLIANCLNAIYFGGILAYLPLVLQRTHGPNAGLFFTADAVGVLLLRVPSGMLADRTRPAVPMVVGLILTLMGLAAFVPPASILTLIVAGAGTGIGAGLFLSGVLTELVGLSDATNRGSAMSFSAASFNLGIFAGSAMAGVLMGPTGFGGVLILGAACCVLAFPPSFLGTSRAAAREPA